MLWKIFHPHPQSVSNDPARPSLVWQQPNVISHCKQYCPRVSYGHPCFPHNNELAIRHVGFANVMMCSDNPGSCIEWWIWAITRCVLWGRSFVGGSRSNISNRSNGTTLHLLHSIQIISSSTHPHQPNHPPPPPTSTPHALPDPKYQYIKNHLLVTEELLTKGQ